MLKTLKRKRAGVLVACMGLLSPGIAHAYIDPGTGAYLVQLLVTLMGAVAVYVMQPVRYLTALFRRITGKSDQAPPR